MGTKHFLKVLYEIRGAMNRQDAIEAMIMLLPIVDIPPKELDFMLLMPPALKKPATLEQKPNRPTVQKGRP